MTENKDDELNKIKIEDMAKEISQIKDTEVNSFLEFVWKVEKENPEKTFHYKKDYMKKLDRIISLNEEK